MINKQGWRLSGCRFAWVTAVLVVTGAAFAKSSDSSASLFLKDEFSTNSLIAQTVNSQPVVTNIVQVAQDQLESARRLRKEGLVREAEHLLVELLSDSSPEEFRRQGLLELAIAAKDQGRLPRAVEIMAQYLSKWPDDPLVPEILLRQGQLFREMGMNNLALAKFYAVMTSSLVLKKDTLDYYQKLVLQAQTEIAETHFLLGKYAEAADFYTRLLKQNSPSLNRPPAQFRLIRSLSALGRGEETVSHALDYLSRYSDNPEQPEVRFHLASALRQLGRNNEALQQVMLLLREQRVRSGNHPETLAYWQRRAGNEIANQLYRQGAYSHALDIYLALRELDKQPAWQLPVVYQIGLVFERLDQPEKAIKCYQEIMERQNDLGVNPSPGLQTILEMARWRADFVQWRHQAESHYQSSKILTSQPADMDGSGHPKLAQ